MGTRSIVGAAALTVLLLAACTDSDPGSGSNSDTVTPAPAADALEETYQDVIDEVLPSVVEIRSSAGLGSGVVFDDDGHIVTNAHVVGTEQQFEVLAPGSAGPLQATLVGTYPPNDVAVVRVTGGRLEPATFGNSSDVRVGEIVLAMGNPLGLAATVTNGIVSAKGRTVTEPPGAGSPGATLPDAIQTSADINPGNSGGALVDLDGEVIGIPTLAAVDPRVGAAAPGIGFAIPSNQAKRFAKQLVENGRVTDSGRAALGVQVTTVIDSSGKRVGVGVVDVVPGGPAAAAGIRPGDVIVSVDGKKTPTAEELGAVLAELQPGQRVPVTVQREGQTLELEVTLGEL
ncbi:S1C family serine protease [Geodermatophilus ruber]|uniref:Serine protease, S1-C subfamily, contains C-terminal PDZ domain n=1 Tax=Geodermatophilus ruber TaxID=504800 RepID=A0A1I4E5K1_9ACTN|nr:trypsin-like peptidase domain-containing protein [Geodermatophilus ruber]SFL00553.1 serine protease, S1-C subfamily, contains C-terminal PDZ domain [Geodermatophilus ruber]